MNNFWKYYITVAITLIVILCYNKYCEKAVYMEGDKYDCYPDGIISFKAYKDGKIIGFVDSVNKAVIRSMDYDSLVIKQSLNP